MELRRIRVAQPGSELSSVHQHEEAQGHLANCRFPVEGWELLAIRLQRKRFFSQTLPWSFFHPCLRISWCEIFHSGRKEQFPVPTRREQCSLSLLCVFPPHSLDTSNHELLQYVAILLATSLKDWPLAPSATQNPSISSYYELMIKGILLASRLKALSGPSHIDDNLYSLPVSRSFGRVFYNMEKVVRV